MEEHALEASGESPDEWLYKDRSALEIMAKPCGKCLFSTRKLVSDERRGQLLADCVTESRHFCCHVASEAGRDVMCRGFFARFPAATPALRLGAELGLLRFLSPEQARQKGPLRGGASPNRHPPILP